jgi:hypothetical protein
VTIGYSAGGERKRQDSQKVDPETVESAASGLIPVREIREVREMSGGKNRSLEVMEKSGKFDLDLGKMNKWEQNENILISDTFLCLIFITKSSMTCCIVIKKSGKIGSFWTGSQGKVREIGNGKLV